MQQLFWNRWKKLKIEFDLIIKFHVVFVENLIFKDKFKKLWSQRNLQKENS